MKRIEVLNFSGGVITKNSPESIPKNALSKMYNFSSFVAPGRMQRPPGKVVDFSTSLEAVADIFKTTLFESPNVFIKAGTVLYRQKRPIKQNLAEQRADWAEFGDWLIVCEGTNVLKYNPDSSLSWLTSCCFDFEESYVQENWVLHQAAIPFRVSHSTEYACTQDWERADLDSDVAIVGDGMFHTTAVDTGGSTGGSPPDADLLLHFDGDFVDATGNNTASTTSSPTPNNAQYKFASGSCLFDGDDDTVYFPYSTWMLLYNLNFTGDFWMYIPLGTTKKEHTLWSRLSTLGSTSYMGEVFWYNLQTETFHFFSSNYSYTSFTSISFQFPITKGVWYHVAIIRGWGGDNNQIAFCINGVAYHVVDEYKVLGTGAGSFTIGSPNYIDFNASGYMDFAYYPQKITPDSSEISVSETYTKFGDVSFKSEGSTAYAGYQAPPPAEGYFTIQQEFTLDVWLRLEGINTDKYGTVSLWHTDGSFPSSLEREEIRISAVGPDRGGPYVDVYVYVYNGSPTPLISLFKRDTSLNLTSTWFHFALVRKDGIYWGAYINGNQIAYFYNGIVTQPDTGGDLRIVKAPAANAREWYYDEYRFSSGNPFNANPNSGLTDTIVVPTQRHDTDEDTELLVRAIDPDANLRIDEFRWKTGLSRWQESFTVPSEEDTGTEETVDPTTSLSGDIAAPLGMDAPEDVITVAIGDGTGLTGAYRYKVSFVNNEGLESNLSSASAEVTVSDEDIDLTDIPQSNNIQVVARNVYRTKAGGGEYYLLTTIDDNTTTTYTDSNGDSELSSLAEDGHDAPPALQAIHSHNSRLFGISSEFPNKLVWCNAWNQIEYFDPNNFETFGASNDNTQRLFTLGPFLTLIQKGKIWKFDTRPYPEYYWVKGQDPTLRGIPSPHAAVDVGPVIFCVDRRGPYLLDAAQTESILLPVDDIFDKNSFNSDRADHTLMDQIAVGYSREHLLLSYPTRYFNNTSYNNKTIVWSHRENKVDFFLDEGFFDFSFDNQNNALYAVGDDYSIYRLFQSSAGSSNWTFKTKEFSEEIGSRFMLKEAGFFWIDCDSQDATITISVYYDLVLKQTYTISTVGRRVYSFRLPDESFYRILFEISGTSYQLVYSLAFEAQPIRGQSEI